MLSSAVLMSLVLSFVLCLCSAFSVLALCGVQSKTKKQSAGRPTTSPPISPREQMELRDRNQPFTSCLSSSSCLRSQSASERTMVSWGSEEEEASPLLEVGTPEERGVSGIRLSSSILRSWCDETDRQPLFSAQILLMRTSTNTPLRGTSSPPRPPPSALFPTPPSAFPAPVGTSPVTMETDTGNTAESSS